MKFSPRSSRLALLSPLVLGPVALTYPLVKLFSLFAIKGWPINYVAYALSGLVTVVVLLFFLNRMGLGMRDLGWRGFKPSHIAQGILGALAAAFLWKGILVAMDILGLPGWGSNASYTELQWQMPIMFLFVAVIGPFVEETLFRGFLLLLWKERFGLPIAFAVSTILFALLHFIPFGIGAVILILPWSIIPAILALRAKSLWPAFVMHLVNNTLAYIVIPLLLN